MIRLLPESLEIKRRAVFHRIRREWRALWPWQKWGCALGVSEIAAIAYLRTLDPDIASRMAFFPGAGIITIIIIIFAVSKVIAKLTTPSSNPTDNSPDTETQKNFTVPTVNPKRPRSLIIGSPRVQPTIVWFGDIGFKTLTVKPKGGKRQDVGTRVTASFGLSFGQESDTILRWYTRNQLVYDAEAASGPDPAVAHEKLFYVNVGKPADINGSKGQGEQGLMYFDGSQDAASYEITVPRDPDFSDRNSGDTIKIKDRHFAERIVGATLAGKVILYKGQTLVIGGQVFMGDNVTTMPPVSAVVKHTTFSSVIPAAWTNKDLTGDANPAYAIAYWAVKEWGLTLNDFDAANLQAVAATLATEDVGISLHVQRPMSKEKWIDEWERHVDGRFFWDEETGTFQLKLFRDDYVLGSLTAYTESQFSAFEADRTSADDLPTEIQISYTSRETGEMIGASPIISSANETSAGSRRIETVAFPWFTRKEPVEQAGARIVNRRFRTLAIGRFAIPETKWTNKTGDTIKLENVAIGGGLVDIIARVLQVGSDADGRNEVEVEWIEDQFGVGNVNPISLDNPPPGVDLRIKSPLRFTRVFNPTGDFVLSRAPDGGDVFSTDAARSLLVMTARPSSGFVQGVEVSFGPGDTGEVESSSKIRVIATGTLKAQFLESSYASRAATFTVENAIETTATSSIPDGYMREVDLTTQDWQRCKVLALLDSGGENYEIVSVKTIAKSGADWVCTGIIRELFATRFLTHALGARVWFFYDGIEGLNGQLVSVPDEISMLDGVDLIVRPYNAFAAGDVALSVARTELPFIIAHWKLDGDGTDSHAGVFRGITTVANNLSNLGTPAYTTGQWGQAVLLDGTNALFRDKTGTQLMAEDNRGTLSAWVYPTDVSGGTIYSEGLSTSANSYFSLALQPSGSDLIVRVIHVNAAGTELLNADSTTTIPLNAWSYIAYKSRGNETSGLATPQLWTKTPTQGVVELDQTSFDYSSYTRLSGLDRVAIGITMRSTNTFPFIGRIDNVKVSATRWSPDELKYDSTRDPADSLGAPIIPSLRPLQVLKPGRVRDLSIGDATQVILSWVMSVRKGGMMNADMDETDIIRVTGNPETKRGDFAFFVYTDDGTYGSATVPLELVGVTTFTRTGSPASTVYHLYGTVNGVKGEEALITA